MCFNERCLGVVDLLGLSRRVNARLLLASTSEVYGGKLKFLRSVQVFAPVYCGIICSSFSIVNEQVGDRKHE